MYLQIGSEKVQVADVVSEGDDVWVKVIAVDVEAQKISLSMKYVDQESGKDLDPFQVKCRIVVDTTLIRFERKAKP